MTWRQYVSALRSNRERGSISIFMATSAVVMIVLVGLAVDLGGQVQATQRARDVAAQAARVGGQQLDEAPAVRGDVAQLDPARSAAAAQDFLAASDVTGTVSVIGATTVVVETAGTYDTKFLSIIGLDNIPVSGSAQARVTRSLDGVEQ